jgi:UDP-glucose 4-epimerase
MRVLVTGGAGYIGSVMVERLLDVGHDVTVIDSFHRGHRGAVPRDLEVIPCDLRDAIATRKVVSNCRADAVVHMAALTLVGESFEKPEEYYLANVIGSFNLLMAMRHAGINRMVFSSTAAVYGAPDQLPVQETSLTRPINPYGQSKLLVEQMLEATAETGELRYAAPRYFNVAGATRERGEDHSPETHIIPVALSVLLGQRDHFTVFGTDYDTPDGTAIRDYVHVIDLADAHLLALERLDQSLGPMNIGTREGFSVREIVESVERVTGKSLPVLFGDRRAGDPPRLVADATRAGDVLGWRPVHSTLDQMVSSAWAWHQAHPHGYQD